MTTAEIISAISLFISLCAASSSLYFGLRDRAKLLVQAHMLQQSLEVSIVNAGRRPIIVRMLVATDDSANYVCWFLGEKGQGLRLGEHERHDLILTDDDFVAMSLPSDMDYPKDLWLEDTIGRRFHVTNARQIVEQVHNNNIVTNRCL